MWMTILKSAKGHFVELDKMLRGVDKKYLKRDLYFPRDETSTFYEELWKVIQKELRKPWETLFGGVLVVSEKGQFVITITHPSKKGAQRKREIRKYTYRLKMKPLITPTPKQAASWKGTLIKPETVEGNWKTPEAVEENKKKKEELAKLKKLWTEKYFTGRSGDKYRIKPAHEQFYNQKKEEYEEWVEENMIPESEREAAFSTFAGISLKPPPNLDISSVSSRVDKEAWDNAHKGHFKLQVYQEGNRIMNINLELKLGFNPPPRNPWSFGSSIHDLSRKENQEFLQVVREWRKYWIEYGEYQKSDEYKQQEKIQKALMRVFNLAEEYGKVKSEFDLSPLFE